MPKVSIRNNKVKKIQKGGENIIFNILVFSANNLYNIMFIGVFVAIIVVIVYAAIGKI